MLLGRGIEQSVDDKKSRPEEVRRGQGSSSCATFFSTNHNHAKGLKLVMHCATSSTAIQP